MTQLHVGQAGLRGDLAAYARRFDLLEVSGEPAALPRRTRLRAWRRQVPEGFVFSLRLPRAVASLESAEAELRDALSAADALGAGWLLITTPPQITPCARTRRLLGALVASLPRQQFRIAWEPRGLWEDPEEEQLAGELDLVLVRDLRRRPPPPGEVIYTRLLALGSSARQSEGALGHILERISDREEALVVVEGSGAVRVRDYLRQSQP